MVWAGKTVHEATTGFSEPHLFSDAQQLKEMMLEVIALGASDTFLQPGYPVIVKKDGRMRALTKRRMQYDEILSMLDWATGSEKSSGLIAQGKEAKGAYVVRHPTEKTATGGERVYRFRVNAIRTEYRANVGVQMVMRLIDSEPASVSSVRLDRYPGLLEACTGKDGIVYMTGATGSGKSTTFSAMLRHIFENDTPIHGNIAILDEPIEYVYDGIPSNHSIPVQMEIGTCVETYEVGIKAMMRHNPSLIVIQETRERATAEASLVVASTGHLAYTTLHVSDVPTIVTRMLSFFPAEVHSAMLFDIINTARVFMNQTLVPKIGGGRVALREHLILTEEMRNTIIADADPERLSSVIRGYLREHGVTMAHAAKDAFEEGLIEESVYRRMAHR